MNYFKKTLIDILRFQGYVLQPVGKDYPFGPDMEDSFRKSYYRNKQYTMTSIERMYGMYKASEYILENKIEGAFVECGVWKGGSTMMGMDVLLEKKSTDREFWLYDTFEGMSEPTDKDIMHSGLDAKKEWEKLRDNNEKESSDWCCASLNEVLENVLKTGYPREKVITVKGKVEDTLPVNAPDKIALLRLDTDWYESTKHELECLFPKISVGGVIIIDDYGCWNGAREAVDEYFSKKKAAVFFQRTDYTGRMAVKISN